jgi:hypothetical protein
LTAPTAPIHKKRAQRWLTEMQSEAQRKIIILRRLIGCVALAFALAPGCALSQAPPSESPQSKLQALQRTMGTRAPSAPKSQAEARAQAGASLQRHFEKAGQNCEAELRRLCNQEGLLAYDVARDPDLSGSGISPDQAGRTAFSHCMTDYRCPTAPENILKKPAVRAQPNTQMLPQAQAQPQPQEPAVTLQQLCEEEEVLARTIALHRDRGDSEEALRALLRSQLGLDRDRGIELKMQHYVTLAYGTDFTADQLGLMAYNDCMDGGGE